MSNAPNEDIVCGIFADRVRSSFAFVGRVSRTKFAGVASEARSHAEEQSMRPGKAWRRRWWLRRPPLTSAVAVRLPILLIAALTAPLSTAKAYSWWYGWDTYAECMDHYAKNPPGKKFVPSFVGGGHYAQNTPEQLCEHIGYEENEKLRKQQEITRIIVLSCRAQSVTDAQFSACVALTTGR